MSWTPLEVEWTSSAKKARKRLSAQARGRVNGAILRFAATGKGDVSRLAGSGGFRLRVGDLRVIFEIIHDRVVMLIIDLGWRGDIY